VTAPERPRGGITSPTGFGGVVPHYFVARPHDHTLVCWAAALGFARRASYDFEYLDTIDRARIALADGITHCLCGMRVQRRGGRSRH
jgi:hypothetical protein